MAIQTSKKHPLVGKLIAIDSDDHDSHTISRFTAEVGPGLMLARRLDPRNGADFSASHLIVLGEVAQDEWTVIFDDWDAYKHHYTCPHQDDEDIVVGTVH